MKTKTIKRKNILSVLAVMIMLAATLLTACSSGETAAAPAKEETPAVEASKESEPVEQVKEDVAEPEATTEPETTEEAEPETTTEEPEVEAVVYEGIDMESTLPGIEWMDTFDGIINEPKLVVFNDETNKKVIVENGDTVEFSLTDTMAAYIPADKESYAEYPFSVYFKNYDCSGRYTIETELQNELNEVGIGFEYSNIIMYGDEEVTLSAQLKVVE